MSSVTTIVRELDEMCEELQAVQAKDQNENGLQVIGRFFNATDDSETYQIIGEIHKRVGEARRQVAEVITDHYENTPAMAALDTIARAFSLSALVNQWANAGQKMLAPPSTYALRSISGQIRQEYPIPKLTEQEQEELLTEAESLIAFIELQQLTEPREDIQRSLMLDGLKLFVTRLKRMKWVGANTTIEALRTFLGAASALEQGAGSNETIESILEKSRHFWKQASDLFGVVSKAYTTGKFFITAWQEMSVFLKSEDAQHLLQLAHEAVKALPPPN